MKKQDLIAFGGIVMAYIAGNIWGHFDSSILIFFIQLILFCGGAVLVASQTKEAK